MDWTVRCYWQTPSLSTTRLPLQVDANLLGYGNGVARTTSTLHASTGVNGIHDMLMVTRPFVATWGYGLTGRTGASSNGSASRVAQPRRCTKYNPRKKAMVTDGGTKPEDDARLKAATEAVELSMSWRPHAGIAAGMADKPELLDMIKARKVKSLRTPNQSRFTGRSQPGRIGTCLHAIITQTR